MEQELEESKEKLADLTLGFEKQALLKNIKNIEAKIKDVVDYIENILKPEYDAKDSEAQAAKESYLRCQMKK